MSSIKTAFVFLLLSGLLVGCGTTALLKGNEAFNDGEYAAAEAYWKPLAEAGNVDAQHNLGILKKHIGDAAAAAFWWEQAVSREFVPSMMQLGALKLAEGSPKEAEALYRRAARWGNDHATAVLEAWGRPVPHADLAVAHTRSLAIRQTRVAQQMSERDSDSDTSLDRVLDYYAAKVEND